MRPDFLGERKTQTMTTDVVDTLLRIEPGSRLDAVRDARPQARANIQASYDALFGPAAGGIAAADRYAVAAFTAALTGESRTRAHYARLLAALDPAGAVAVDALVAEAERPGPYGVYPAGPLTAEDAPGPLFAADAATRAGFGARLAAGLAHAHLLVLHPRDTGPAAIAVLAAAGWSPTDIVTLSQIVAYVSFQARLVAGLSHLQAA